MDARHPGADSSGSTVGGAIPSRDVVQCVTKFRVTAAGTTCREDRMSAVDGLIAQALDALGRIVPYDLATVMQLDGDDLAVRVARGRLRAPEVEAHRLRLADFPSIRDAIRRGRVRAFTERDHGEGDGDPFDGVLDLPHGHFCMVAPFRNDRGPAGVITLDRSTCGVFPDEAVALVDVFARLLGLAVTHGEQSEHLERLRRQLVEQNRLLTEEVGGSADCCALVEALPSASSRHVVQLARQVAPTDAPVLITGETGTGKDVLAAAIHAWSARRGRPMVRVNCAALPASLIESELFGHVRGAFSGATQARMGRFQASDGGTLFLDEVGEIPPEVQAKLLRALGDGTFEPVGSDRTVRVDVRVVAATNRDLAAAIAEGSFREDLYYRLAVFPIALPPLRARPDDIAVIARNFLDRLASRTGRGPWRLTPADEQDLAARRWAGNARELVNKLERGTILARGDRLVLGDGAPLRTADEPSAPRQEAVRPLAEVERDAIVEALRHTGGRIAGEGGAAALLGLHPNTLRSRMQKLGLGRARDIAPPRAQAGSPRATHASPKLRSGTPMSG
jgi:formate hydrogenlyase transcriptional activator